MNLATGEEEYRPAPDLTVYNPTGPSVSWGRIYNSMRSDGTMFGAGWSDAYNVGVEYSIGPIEPTASPNTVQANSASGKATSPQPAAKQPARTSCYVVFANGSQVQCFAPSSHGPTSYDPVIEFDPNPGIRLKAIGTYDSTTGLTSFRVVFADRTTWVTAPDQTYGYNFQRIHQLIDRNGNSIQFSYAYYNSMVRLTGIADASGAALLTLGLDANGNATSATDRYGRSVYYACGTPFSGNSSKTLTQVSQVVASGTTSPPVRYQYGYVNEGNGEATSGYVYLGSIAVPSPTGTGMATSTIAYDPYYVTVTSITDANGNKRLYSNSDWDGSSNANVTTVKVESPVGNVLYQYTVTFDGSMNKMSQKSADGQTGTSQSFGSGGATYNPGSVTDGLGHTWTRTYDTFGNTLTATTPKGTTTTFSYAYGNFSLGELTSVQQGSKTATSYSYYEPSGLQEEIDSPTPGTSGGGTVATSFTYDAIGNLTKITAPGNNAAATRTTLFGYTTDGSYTQTESLGRPITVTDALGKVSHLRYDARGNLLSTTDALGNQSQSTFNLADQPLTTALPATGNTGSGHGTQSNVYLYPGGPAVESDALDESGNLVRAIYSTFGPEGETLAVSGAAESVSGTYDALYRAKTVSDGKGGATTFSYDAKGRLAEIDYPGATGTNTDRVRFTSYDAVGRLLSRTDGNGQVTNYTFGDTDGLLTKVDYPGATANDVTMAYDGYGRLVSSNDATGASTTAYDDLGSVTSATRTYTGLPAQTFSYGYYPDGSRETMTNAAGTWSYGYDADGRYTSMASPAGTSTATYYDNGWPSQRALPCGRVTNYAYDAVGALTSHDNYGVSAYGSFTYDGVFNLTAFASNVPSAPSQSGATNYAYDAKDRLTSESSTRLGGYSQANGYDAAGNSTTLRNASQAFDADNRSTASAYDGNGSPTTYQGSAMAYDPEARATTLPGGVTAGYRADGLRAWKGSGGTRYYAYYDRGEPVLETDGSGNVAAINVFAPDGLAARWQGSWTQYLFDPEGNVAQRLDASGNVRSSSAYDGYGNETSTGGAPDPFGYHGRDGYYSDRVTGGLILCGQRYYDPGAGRWLTRDPLGMGGGVNLYGYCQSGPIGHADPAGLAMDSVSEYCEKYPKVCADLMKIIGGAAGTGTALGRAVEQAEENGEEEPAMSVLQNMGERDFGNLMHGYMRGGLSDNLEGWRPTEFGCRGVGRIDAINLTDRLFFEFKAAGAGDNGWNQVYRYANYLNRAYPDGPAWKGAPVYYPSPFHPEGWGLEPPGWFD